MLRPAEAMHYRIKRLHFTENILTACSLKKMNENTVFHTCWENQKIVAFPLSGTELCGKV